MPCASVLPVPDGTAVKNLDCREGPVHAHLQCDGLTNARQVNLVK